MSHPHDHRIYEAVHVFHECRELADLLREQHPNINNGDLTDKVQRHTGDYLGVTLRTLGYDTRYLNGVPAYVESLTSQSLSFVLVLANSRKRPFRSFSGASFFITRNAQKVLQYFTGRDKILRARARVIVPLSVAGSILGYYVAGEPELGAIAGAAIGSLGAFHSVYDMKAGPHDIADQFVEEDFIAIASAVEVPQRIREDKMVENYWTPPQGKLF